MIKLIKLIKDFDRRLTKLENTVNCMPNQDEGSDQSSYKEVIDEWLNGKKS